VRVPCPYALWALYIGNEYLQVAPWWAWVLHATTLALVEPLLEGVLTHIPNRLPPTGVLADLEMMKTL